MVDGLAAVEPLTSPRLPSAGSSSRGLGPAAALLRPIKRRLVFPRNRVLGFPRDFQRESHVGEGSRGVSNSHGRGEGCTWTSTRRALCIRPMAGDAVHYVPLPFGLKKQVVKTMRRASEGGKGWRWQTVVSFRQDLTEYWPGGPDRDDAGLVET